MAVWQVMSREGLHSCEQVGRAPQEGGAGPVACETRRSLPGQRRNPDAAANRFCACGVIARLAQLAAALELERTAPVEEQLSCA